MAIAPQHPCSYPGCAAVVGGREGRCSSHAITERREIEQHRGSAASRGYDSRWRAARKQYLALNPLCVMCLEIGRPRVATIVDHVLPHKGDSTLFWDRSNWRALCKHCHDRKTASSDGRWG